MLNHLPATRPERRRGEAARSTAVSALAHAALIALLVWAGRGSTAPLGDEGAGTGVGSGEAGGGGGGGAEQLTYFVVPAAAEGATPAPEHAARARPPLPAPVSVPQAAAMIAPPLDLAVPDVTLPPLTGRGGSGTGRGGGAGPGTGPGRGPGSGGGSGGGEGGGIGSGVGPGAGRGRIISPSPVVLLLPPPAPRTVRGQSVTVRLEVDTLGVVRDVELVPPTGDARFDDALRRAARGWRFRPARDRANRPVAALFEVVFGF